MTAQLNDSGRPDNAIAIIGMACIFPGARNVGEFWRNILNGVDAISDPPERAWDPDIYYDPNSTATDRVYTKRGGYIEDYATFDPLPFGVPPKDVGGEPDQWLALKLAREALLDAGYADAPESVRRRTAVVLGRGLYPNSGSVNAVQHTLIVTQTLDVIRQLQPDLTEQELDAIRTQLRESLPKFGADTAPALTPNMITGRIANRLDLMGPNYTVDAACASSLVAMKMASRELLTGECDMALAGGSQLWTSMPILGVFGQMGALSRTEQIRPFDKDADGTLLSEGVAFVVLKRLADAERDKDRIYAVIRGIGVSSDGRASGLMAPRVEGQVLAMRRAYEDAGIPPETVKLIEAHGTGTPVGDVTEITSMTSVFGERRGLLPDVAIGSVKSMIGHALPAAGTAGLIKAALSLYHRVLPPSLHCDEPNPELGLENTPFYINSTTRPWINGYEHPRRAGVSAFGFGGINGHVVLEEYVPPAPVADEELPRAIVGDVREYLPEWDSELCVVSGASREELAANVASLAARMEAGDTSKTLTAIAHELAGDVKPEHEHRLSIVATSVEDLRTKAQRAADRLADPACKRIREASGVFYTSQPLGREGKVAFLFPGEGSQYQSMLSQLALHFPEARAAFDEMDAVHLASGNEAPSKNLFPPPQATAAEHAAANEYLWTMEGAVTSVLASDEAMRRVLEALGVQADCVAGHSSGEYAALRTAGVFDNGGQDNFTGLARILLDVHDESMRDDAIEPAVLLACGTDRETAEALLKQTDVQGFVAMDNCPNQVVIVARESGRDALVSAAREKAIIVEVLNFDRPYHTPWFRAYSERMRSTLRSVRLSAPRLTAYSCATAGVVSAEPGALQDLVAGQWSEAVEFRRLIENLYEDGYRIFVEVGPGNHLTAFVEDILRGKQIIAVASNVQQRSDLSQLNHLAGQLFAQGVGISVDALTRHRFQVSEAPTKASPTEVHLITGFSPMTLDPAKLALPRAKEPATETDSTIQAPAEGSAAAGTSHAVDKGEELIAVDAAAFEGARTMSSQSPPPVEAFTQHPQASQDQLAAVTHRFLDTMDHFLAVQERVLLAYLNAGSDAPAQAALTPPQATSWLPAPSNGYQNGAYSNGYTDGRSPAPTYPVEVTRPNLVASAPAQLQPEPAALAPAYTNGSSNGNGSGSSPAPVAAWEPAPAVSAPEAPVVTASPTAGVPLIEKLRQIVSDRTGYPAEVIDVNADLEADLGIDSIKRVEILGTLRSQDASLQNVDLERLTVCRTLQQIMDVLSGEAGGGPFDLPSVDEQRPSTEGQSEAHPVLGRLLQFEPERLAVARLTIDPAQALWLRDHTIGREVSFQEPGLQALPVMPLTLTLELLAQLAVETKPGLVVTSLVDVRAKRWIEFGDGSQTVELRAERAEASEWRFRCRASIVQDEEPLTAVEADIILAPAYALRPSVPDPGSETPSTFAPEDIYQAVLYHGETWQGVLALDGTGLASVSGRLRGGDSLAFRDGEGEFTNLTDPVALDAAGQLLGLWTAEHFEAGRLVFPIGVRSIEFFGPPSHKGENLHASATISRADDLLVEANITVWGESGVQARLNGWLDRRFHIPPALEPVVRPRSLPWLAQELQVVEIDADEAAVCLCLDATLEDETGLLRRVWASRIRSESERMRAGLRVESVIALMREHLSKEATCRLIWKTAGVHLLPADVTLEEVSEAEVHPVGTSLSSLGVSPDVWLGQAGNTLIAVAGVTRTDAGARRLLAAELALKAHEAEDSHVV